MADQVEISIPRPVVNEGSAFTATANFRTRSTAAASTPTTVRYRVDDPCYGEILAWTSASAASSVTITVSSAANEIQDESNTRESRLLTFEADAGLSTQVRGTVAYDVQNVGVNVT